MISKTDEIALIAKVNILGDKRAFEKLVISYQASIRRFFLNMTMGDTLLSDDLAQETFIKAYLNLSGFKGLSGFSTWLFRIAYNVYYDSVRARKYWDDLDSVEVDKIYSVNSEYSEENADIYTALKYLRNEERTAILLFYMEDKSHVEISKIMKCPLGTVKTYILKGKENLSKYLSKEDGYGSKR